MASELQAVMAMDRSIVGHRQMRAKYLRLFPSDTLLKYRLGGRVWEMFLFSEADRNSRLLVSASHPLNPLLSAMTQG